jgi:hypothetical protein
MEIKGLPGRIFIGKPMPADEDLPFAASLLSTQGTVRPGKKTPIQHRREGARSCRRVTTIGLQQAHMKHIVKTRPLRKLQHVRHLPDTLEDTEWSSIMWPKLALGARVQELGGAVKEAEPHPIASSKLQITMAGVVVPLGQLMSLKQTLAEFRQDLIPRTQGRSPPPCGQFLAYRAARAEMVGCTPLQMESHGELCGRRYCNNTPPKTASPPKRADDHLSHIEDT